MANNNRQEELAGYAPENLALPDYIEQLELLKLGGMGAVYRGVDSKTSEPLAVKVLRPKHLEDEIARRRFMKEAHAVSSLKHVHIVDVRDYGVTVDNAPYMVMEFLNGIDLWNKIDNSGKLEVRQAARVFMQVADGLGHAHQAGIIHRDLKPSNIMLTEDEQGESVAKLVDFGIAKFFRDDAATRDFDTPLTLAGETVGTPLFMSPEQCLGKPVDERSDVYALGLVVYLTLTGKLPIEGKNAVEIFGKHVSYEVDLSLVPSVMRPVVGRCLEKEPADRYQTMRQLRDDLERIFNDRTARFKFTGRQRKGFRYLTAFALSIFLSFLITFIVFNLINF